MKNPKRSKFDYHNMSLQADRLVTCNCSSLSPSTHLCPPEDIFHSCVPRLCPPCSSTFPGWDGWAAHARSPWNRTLSGSTEPVQVENLTEVTTGFHVTIPYWKENFMSFNWFICKKQSWEKTQIRTNTSIPVQHQTDLAGTFEAA